MGAVEKIVKLNGKPTEKKKEKKKTLERQNEKFRTRDVVEIGMVDL